ncbi:HAMP domain-containing histidine kinase [Nocardioides sp. Y6]|uniref:histidine kinase n=1 Tax=Nocardioides malaquae TaxID=2773426 RepID=A0ABR9RRC4_9ACTN|nr:HAMP domain-containing sensor histidine kinase [Nocardioides malaquae]MBE7324111.1 HAMP domain-containing histidine kinase [Nocardioides malaquae]
MGEHTERQRVTPVPQPRDGTRWGTDADRDAVSEFARDIADRAGFAFCAVHVLRADQVLELVAVHGSAQVPDRRLGITFSLDSIQPILACGSQHENLIFVTAEQLTADATQVLERFGYRKEGVPPQRNTWRSQDLLVVRLCDGQGELRGLLHLDRPVNGRRPSETELTALADELRVTSRAVLTAIEREEFAQSARLAAAARQVIRQAGSEVTIHELLQLASEQLREGFRATDVQVHLQPQRGLAPRNTSRPSGEVVTAVASAVDHAWRRQSVVIVEPDHAWGDGGHLAPVQEELAATMQQRGAGMSVLVPVGTLDAYFGMLVIQRPPGHQLWSESDSRAAVEVGHDLAHAVMNARDHEREQAWVDELRRLDRYRNQMVSTVTHELRNPLGVIMGHLELLEEQEDVPDPWLRSLLAMRRAANRLDVLSEDLLTLNRLDASDTPRTTGPVDLAEVVTEAVELAELDASRREIPVRVQVDGGPYVVEGDRTELSRVVTNLLSNAIKYSDPGEWVTVALTGDAGAVVLSVRDEGIGVSDADQTVLFEEFFRSTNTNALERPGTGLGLPIVRRIVQRHGGRISFTSTLGEGTTFTVILPRPGLRVEASHNGVSGS